MAEEGGEVVAVALRTWRHLVLSRIDPRRAPEALDRLVADLTAQQPQAQASPAAGQGGRGGESGPQGVVGPTEVARAFAERWSARTGQVARCTVAMRIFQLDVVNPVRGVPGALRPATLADADLVARWTGTFWRDIGESGGPEAAQRTAEAAIRAGGLHFWQLGEPGGPGQASAAASGQVVSMANATGATPHGIRINMVYTPPAHRRRGYASAAVAALSQAMLDAGRRFCFLFTDLSNPTSNHIYQTIGYRPVADADSYSFLTPDPLTL